MIAQLCPDHWITCMFCGVAPRLIYRVDLGGSGYAELVQVVSLM